MRVAAERGDVSIRPSAERPGGSKLGNEAQRDHPGGGEEKTSYVPCGVFSVDFISPVACEFLDSVRPRSSRSTPPRIRRIPKSA